jgi:hypothetical protein
MRFCRTIQTSVVIASVSIAAAFFHAQAQDASKEAPVRAIGLSPRPTPADYQFRVQAGTLTLCGEFMGHGVPTEEGGPYSTDNYVVVEAALFSTSNARIQLSYRDFSLRVNGKKQVLPGQSYVLVFPSLKDPEWEPSSSQSFGSVTSINGAGGSQSDRTKSVPKMPIELRHTMEQRVLKASISEGERALPQAGLLFFEFHGETKSIHSMELLYSGPAGKATLALQKP